MWKSKGVPKQESLIVVVGWNSGNFSKSPGNFPIVANVKPVSVCWKTEVCSYPPKVGWVWGKVVNGTLKQVRALRIIHITAQGKI
jgi:hypothetical protein